MYKLFIMCKSNGVFATTIEFDNQYQADLAYTNLVNDRQYTIGCLIVVKLYERIKNG